MKRPVQPFDPESYDALAALFEPLGKRACPLYSRLDGGAYNVIGTAVPVRGLKYAALLTASHVVDELEEGQVVIAGSRTFLRFPSMTVRFSHGRPAPTVDVDIAAIALPAAAAEELGGYYEFTGAGETGEFEDYSKLTLYGFVGCPHTKNKDRQHESAKRMVKPYFYVTREYAVLPPPQAESAAPSMSRCRRPSGRSAAPKAGSWRRQIRTGSAAAAFGRSSWTRRQGFHRGRSLCNASPGGFLEIRRERVDGCCPGHRRGRRRAETRRS